ncbi:unnamed protein product [Urochloa humidicola]
MASTAPQALISGGGDDDWGNLTAGPAGRIAERVLSNDYVDFLRFRAVCRAWRAGAAHLRAHGALDRRFLPRRWILLPPTTTTNTGGRQTRRCFLNVVTGELIGVELQVLLSRNLLGHTAEGLLVLCRRDGTHAVQILNPLTGQVAGLPNASLLLYATGERLEERLRNFVLRGGGLAGDGSMVALHFRSFYLSVAKPGDLYWTRLIFHDVINSVLPFQGRIYLANPKNVSLVEAPASQHQPPRHAVAALHGRGKEAYLKNGMSLANNDGDLILCYHVRTADESCNHRRCSVCRVGLDSGDMASLVTLKGKALFTSPSRSVLVSTEVSSCIDADTVYVCSYVHGQPKVIACDLESANVATQVNFDMDDTAFHLVRYVLYS